MKVFIVMMTVGLFAVSILKEDGLFSDEKHRQYCARMQDGELVVEHDGKKLTSDVTLSDSTRIKTNGTILTKSGTITMLKAGECIDENGKITEKNSGEKINRK